MCYACCAADRRQAGVVITLDELPVEGVVDGAVVVIGVDINFDAIVFPGVGRVIEQVGIQDPDGNIQVGAAPHHAEGHGVIGRADGRLVGGGRQVPASFAEIAVDG